MEGEQRLKMIVSQGGVFEVDDPLKKLPPEPENGWPTEEKLKRARTEEPDPLEVWNKMRWQVRYANHETMDVLIRSASFDI